MVAAVKSENDHAEATMKYYQDYLHKLQNMSNNGMSQYVYFIEAFGIGPNLTPFSFTSAFITRRAKFDLRPVRGTLCAIYRVGNQKSNIYPFPLSQVPNKRGRGRGLSSRRGGIDI